MGQKGVNIHSFAPLHTLPWKIEKFHQKRSFCEKGKSNLGFWFQISKIIIVKHTHEVNSKKLETFRSYSVKNNSRCDQVISRVLHLNLGSRRRNTQKEGTNPEHVRKPRQNDGNKKTKHAKFSKKWTFLILMVSMGKKCLFFGKFSMFYFFVSSVLTFAIFPYFHRTKVFHCFKLWKTSLKIAKKVFFHATFKHPNFFLGTT